jgi:hypothetical protein
MDRVPFVPPSKMDALADALRCGLTGQIMEDPVIVCTKVNPRLVMGMSYERAALERWLRERGDDKTKYGTNTALRSIIEEYRHALVVKPV